MKYTAILLLASTSVLPAIALPLDSQNTVRELSTPGVQYEERDTGAASTPTTREVHEDGNEVVARDELIERMLDLDEDSELWARAVEEIAARELSDLQEREPFVGIFTALASGIGKAVQLGKAAAAARKAAKARAAASGVPPKQNKKQRGGRKKGKRDLEDMEEDFGRDIYDDLIERMGNGEDEYELLEREGQLDELD
ncbi:hypothetical protein DFP72DRAFT_870848 [Ephemerocybe angulata]|uniref:Uncharacterized protein n=1 Tax=Ephemerocybe angulata TaxID=980116 RepID=A0A8H6MD58_9AGAR|nr:hypothetical protein DFP72DRAFT_870848 [Tulosesus angulatus]